MTSGDTLTVSLDIDSLDEIDVFRIRATSTSTDAGSIKAVSDDPPQRSPRLNPSLPKTTGLSWSEPTAVLLSDLWPIR